jgi:cell division septation protein DedD
MKKLFFMGTALFMALAMTSCKSSESQYKKAWEKAQAAQANNQAMVQQQTVTTPTQQQQTAVQVTPVTPMTTQTNAQQDYSNVSVRTEDVTLVNGNGLRAYSVVVGSFKMQSNAQAEQSKYAQKGYAAQIVSAMVNGEKWFRVIASTHDTKAQAAQSRAALLGTQPDAWLLYKK